MLSTLRRKLARSTDSRTRNNRPPSARLALEPLSDRVMMSATPLTYTTALSKGLTRLF